MSSSSNSNNACRKLEDNVSAQVLASSSIPALHNVVEEVVLNAVDAKSTRIEVYLNFPSLSITVIDNGVGISKDDLIHRVGEWHHSSKQSTATYGFKGQALAALRYLAERVEVSSCLQGQDVVCTKVMTNTSQEVSLQPTQSGYTQHGTTINIQNLYLNLPVRAKAVKREVEVSLIKDFLQNMSVLHHHISWQLVDQSRKNILCNFPSQLSVSKQLINFHGMQVVSKMKAVRFESSRFVVEGLLSAPTQSCCSWTKDCQYMYINNRWMRNKDYITQLLNKYYSRIFSVNQFGPSPKHSSAEAVHNLKFPMFVLTFSCPPTDCDILVEPDKTVIYFKHQDEIESFIISFLSEISKVDYPDFNAALQKLQSETSNRVDLTPTTTPSKKQKVTPHTEKLFWDDLIKAKPMSSLTSGLEEDSSLLLAFMSSPPKSDIDSNHVKDAPKSVRFDSIASSGTISKIPSFIQMFSEPPVANLRDVEYESEEMFVAEQSPMATHSLDQKTKSQFTTEILQREGMKVKENIDIPAPVVSSKKELTLEKQTLQHLVYLGRWDNKFMLAMDMKTSLVVALDQHAVDERINYEEFFHRFTQEDIQVCDVNKSRKITLREFQLLQSHHDILQTWGFDFHVDTNGKLYLVQVPVVFGESLTADDLLEFLHYIHDHQDLPPSVLKPPAVQRILASKACHAAIKFGDFLSGQQSVELIDKLTHTELPFQCAHGRPSAVPLMDWKDLFRWKRSQRQKKIRPHF